MSKNPTARTNERRMTATALTVSDLSRRPRPHILFMPACAMVVQKVVSSAAWEAVVQRSAGRDHSCS